MKNTVRVNKVIAIVMIVVALFVAFGAQNVVKAQETTTKAIGTIERNAEFVNEALAEKAHTANSTQVETEPVVEGATGSVETEATVETEEIVVAKEAAPVEAKKANETAVVEEVVREVETTEALEADIDYTEAAELASTPATVEVTVNGETIDASVTEESDDAIAVNFGAAEANYTAVNTTATQIGIAGKEAKGFAVIGDNTLRNGLQKVIDAGNIVCYPNADMTQGVKYFAGHNPGAMSFVNTTKVGTVIRLANGETYQDYKVVEIVQGAGSFSDIKFKKAGTDLWTMLRTWNENAIVVQFCRNNVNTFHYAVAI